MNTEQEIAYATYNLRAKKARLIFDNIKEMYSQTAKNAIGDNAESWRLASWMLVKAKIDGVITMDERDLVREFCATEMKKAQ